MNKFQSASLLLIVAGFLISIYFYPQMPERIASHWNAKGEIDGYASRGILLLIPAFTIGVFVLLMLIPKIDPLRENIKKFRKYYDIFILFITGFLIYIHSLTIAANLGYYFDMTLLLFPALAALFFYMGILLEHAKRNWFIGIRTPWTLSSDTVWRKTHRLGSALFKALAFLFLFGMVFKQYLIYFILIPVLVGTLALIVYSYLEFEKERRKK